MIIRILFFVVLFSALPVVSQTIYLTPMANSSVQNSGYLAEKLSWSGDVLGLCGADKSIKLLDPATLAEKNSYHTELIKSFALAFPRHGKTFMSASADGRISVWEYSKPDPVTIFPVDPGVRCIDIDAAGRVVCSGYNRIISLWDPVTGKRIVSFPQTEAEIIRLVYSSDGKLIIAGCSDGSICMFDVATCTLIRTINDHHSYVTSVACAHDGKYFAVAFADSMLSLFNVKTGTLSAAMVNRAGVITSLAFHPNSKYLISASTVLSFWDIATGSMFKSVADSSCRPLFVTVAAEKPILAVCGRNGELRTYLMQEKKEDTMPPRIALIKPASGAGEQIKVYANDIEIAGIVSDEDRIGEVTVNGTAVSTAPADPRDRKGIDSSFPAMSFSTTMPLTVPGLNTFVISASDMEKNTSKQVITVTKLTKDACVELINAQESTELASIDLQFKLWLDWSSYSLIINTMEITSKDNLSKEQTGMLRSQKISLSAGLNQVQLVVNGRGGEKIRKTINISRKILGALPIIASENKLPPGSSRPQCWAVVVGVSKYGNTSIKNLSYADRDAQAFADFLKTSAGGGFQDERIKLLLNEQATLYNVKQALFNFLRQTIDKDLVIIYFAGHGAPEPSNPANNYLLCYDTEPASLATTAFPMWDVNTALTRYIPSKRVVVFTDACHSGGITSDIATRGMSATNDNLINQYLADLSKTKEGIIVFTASQAGEVSQELVKFGHGVFTHYLLEGMQGNADFNNDYVVSIGELMDYVEEKVKRQTNGNQHPTRNQGTYDKDLIISLIPH